MLAAEDRLRAGNVSDRELYDTVLLATGSEAQASEALYHRAKARHKRGETFDPGD